MPRKPCLRHGGYRKTSPSYVDHLVPLTISGFVTANESPTVTLKVPADPTIWATSQWYSSHQATAAPWPIPDPLIVLADMYRARGVGAFETETFSARQ